MFRTYTISEVERLCGISRRTISEYVAKGLLSGPSHRGRGARYPQSDVDALKLLPRFRTLMKREFPNLKALAAFLRQLSIRDLHQLAAKSTESTFVLEVRRLRVRNSLAALAPHVAPERIEAVLGQLTPGQIRAIDSGRYQIGAVLDIGALVQDMESTATAATSPSESDRRSNGHAYGATPTVSVSWLDRGDLGQLNGSALEPADIGSLEEVAQRMEARAAAKLAADETQPDLLALLNGRNSETHDTASHRGNGLSRGDRTRDEGQNLGQRLNEISQRLERLEAMLAND